MTILDTRNSYAKTDHDATFMRMKDDYMRNGEVKKYVKAKLSAEKQARFTENVKSMLNLFLVT